MATMTALATTTLSSAASTITFSSIPQTYTDLRILLSGRTNFAGGHYGGGTLQFNGDTGNNYSWRRFYGDTTTPGTSGNTAQSGISQWDVNSGTTTANTFGNAQIYIPNYTSSIAKSVSIEYSVENNSSAGINGMLAGLWSGTTGITSVTLLSTTFGAYDFQQYTTATLYGVWNGPETLPSTPTIGTATDTGTGTSVSVAFTPTSATGVDANFTALSTPGSIAVTGTSSPITVTGLTTSTPYTFQVRANNPGGSSAYSAASNSVTPTASGSFDSIATLTLSSNADTMGFTSIPGTYKHLQIRGTFNSTAVPNGTPRFTLNGDSGSNYSIQTIRNSTIDNYNNLGSAYMSLDAQQPGYFTSFVLDIFDYTDTNKFKTFQFRQTVANYVDSVFYNIFGTGNYRSLSAITSFTLTDQQVSDLTTLSTMALYGIKV